MLNICVTSMKPSDGRAQLKADKKKGLFHPADVIICPLVAINL